MTPAHIVPQTEGERSGEQTDGLVPGCPRSSIPPVSGTRNVRSSWTIVKTFEQEGHQYELRRRPLKVRGPLASLTQREEQVLACALDGKSNKSIAYTLGIAPSTVGVLLFRAATKLGAKSRPELLSSYARRCR